MTQPTYEQLQETCSLLFHSYVKTVDAIQNEWGDDIQIDDRASRTMSGLLGTLEHDAASHAAASVGDLVDLLASMNLIESGSDVETNSTRHRDDNVGNDTGEGFSTGILSQE